MRRKARSIALISSLIFTALIFGQALAWAQEPAQKQPPAKPQQPLVGKALYDKLMTEGRRMMGGMGRGGFGGTLWTPDGKATYAFEDGTFKKTDVLTGQKTPLFDDAKILAAVNAMTGRQEVKLFFNRFQYLEGGRKIEFQGLNKTFIYDLAASKLVLFEPEKTLAGVRGRGYGGDVLSPDLKYRAFTRDYNLFIKDMDGAETALTTNGTEDLRNGYPDWVYPEELDQNEGFWWSPDSKKIAFLQWDQSPVAKYPIVHEVTPMPRYELQGYPVPGANNPILRIFVADIASKKLVRVDTGDDLDTYLYQGQWTNDGKEFTYFRLNRLQNKVELFAADPATGRTRLFLTDTDPCYLEPAPVVFLSDNQRFLWTSERSGWRAIYLYELATGKLLKQLTTAPFPVQSIREVDEARGIVYFTGQETNGAESHLYKVKLDGTGFARVTKEPGSHNVSLSPTFEYYVDTYSSFEQPTRSALYKADGKEIRVLNPGTVSQEFKDLKLIQPERIVFKSADGQYDLDGLLYFPAHFDPADKYPLLFSIYGGPGTKGVTNSYKMADGNQALAQLGFLVAVCDFRGGSGRGKAFQNLSYMKLGQLEIDDHAAFVKALAARPYVDTTRVGVTGHSYGGYFTCMALLRYPEVFQVGVAGAPVTDWHNYDSIYTERFMRRPQDNPDGYEKGSCLTYAKNLKGKLFIHHGTVDDNVHPCNTIELVQALLKENKTFDLMMYPEQQHGINVARYPASRLEYFIEHLKPVVK